MVGVARSFSDRILRGVIGVSSGVVYDTFRSDRPMFDGDVAAIQSHQETKVWASGRSHSLRSATKVWGMRRVSLNEESRESNRICIAIVGARHQRQPNAGTGNRMLNQNQRVYLPSGLYIDTFTGVLDLTPLLQAIETDT
jgi:hypothetical protein